MEFKPRKAESTTCSRHCKLTLLREENRRRNQHRLWNVPTGTVGAIHELIVCTDLLKRGYHVFRAMSPACPCDVAVLCNKQLLRVEVTTGAISGNGNISHPTKDASKFDILAIVIGGEVEYRPCLPILGLETDAIPAVPSSELNEG
jgi:hypothetical protein